MKKYKVALIGCGWIGMGSQLDPIRPKPASHTEAIFLNERFELAAMVDTDINALKVASRLYTNIPLFASFEAMTDSLQPDVVVIATHPDSHCTYIKKAVNAGARLILSEKPISHNSEEAVEVIELCNSKNIILLINHMRRFDHLIRSMKSYVNNEYVRDTAIGKVRSVVASYDHGLYHGGTHIIDLLRFFLGEVLSVSAVYNRQVQQPKDDINVDAILQFENCNAMFYFINSRECAVGEVNFIGEKGILALKNMWGMNMEIIGTMTCSEYPVHQIPDYINSKKFGISRSFLESTYNHIANCLDGTEKPISSGEDALKTLEVIKCIEESANNNGRVTNLKN